MVMRRRVDKLAVTCTALCILCALVVVVFVAPTVLHNRATTERIDDLSRQTRHDAGVTTAALCALRSDLERRIASSQAFLREHPDGIPGIPARTIRDGIKNQERTIRALSRIDC
jgi:hypothetical protein